MTTLFPAALDDFSNPAGTGSQATPRTHAQQHGDLNDAIEAVQRKVGVTGSTDPASLEARVAAFEPGGQYPTQASAVAFTPGGVSPVPTTVEAMLRTLDPETMPDATGDELKESLFARGGFTNSYDTDLWIAGVTRTDPTNNSQGLYIQHRVAGNLGGLVHDAGASELRLSGASNTGAGQSAHECSLVVTGGVNAIGSMSGVLSNFHTEGTPTGTVDDVALVRASQIPALAGGFSITTVYGVKVDNQIVGTTNNYSVYAPDGKSVFGPIVPKNTTSQAVTARGLSGQDPSTAVFSVQNSSPTTVFQVFANGTAGFGGFLSGNTLSVNNNLATGATVGLRVRGHGSQSVDVVQAQNSAGTAIAGITKAGALYTAANAAPADADIAAGQCYLWFDSTNGAAKLMIKAKQADGTVRTGSVALA